MCFHILQQQGRCLTRRLGGGGKVKVTHFIFKLTSFWFHRMKRPSTKVFCFLCHLLDDDENVRSIHICPVTARLVQLMLTSGVYTLLVRCNYPRDFTTLSWLGNVCHYYHTKINIFIWNLVFVICSMYLYFFGRVYMGLEFKWDESADGLPAVI